MKASIVDLRYKTRDILKALERNESVTVLYHGKIRGILKPAGGKSKIKVCDHKFFNMYDESPRSVEEEMNDLRKPRYDF